MKKNLLSLLLLCFFALTSAFAQSGKITGKVVGADDGLPLPGVTVKIKGTQTGSQTNGDGVFNISARAGQVLVFTYIGYLEQTITVTSSVLPTIKMATNTKMLTEVVVQDSYGVQSKKSYAGSATVVAGVQNENKPFTTPMQALQGEVAGANINLNSGQPGANVQIRIRGTNSISLSSQPLYVVDGMFINAGDLTSNTTTSTTLAGINENDIESIAVLKDAAATAIYGSRGTNGVIVITTKRGKSGKTAIRFDAEVGSTKNLPLPDAGKPLTADQYSTILQDGLINAGISPTAPTGIPAFITSYGLNGQSNDWYNLVTRTGKQQQYNVSLNGGSDNSRFFVSGGYFKQEATTIGSGLTRISGLLNFDQTISKRFSLNLGLNVSNVGQNTPSTGGTFASPILSSYFLRPFQLAYNADGSLNSTSTGNTNFPDIFNPLYVNANDKKFDSQTRALTNATLKWNIWDELKFSTYASIDYSITEEQMFNNPIMGDGKSVGGRAYDYTDRYFNYLFRNQLAYRYNFKSVENFYIDAAVGYEAQKNQGYFVKAASQGYPATQPLLTASANASTPTVGNATFSTVTNNAIFALATINYKNLYTLSGSFRRDGSSVFGVNNQYGNFYSIGGTWNVDEQDYFQKQNIASSLKLRASIGTTGNQAGIGAYQARATAGYGVNYNGANGQNYNVVGNPALTWETAQKFDVGTDIGFLKERLTVSFDYYDTEVNHLLLNAPLSVTTGFGSILQNIGNMRNRGEEITIRGIPVKTRDFVWNTNFNIAFNHNTVLGLVNHAPIINGVFHQVEGLDVNTYYIRYYAGVDPANGNALWFTDGTRTATTSNYAAALRADQYQGDPKYFGGFNNTFNYKGIILSADFYYNFGNMIRDSWASYLLDGNNYAFNKYQYQMNRWTTPGQITDVPKYVAGGIASNASNSFSTRQIFYGDYIRLKNISIGYDLKSLDLLKKLGVSKLYIYGRGTNIWTKTYDKKLPFDPEVGVTGQSNLEIPQSRTFTIGLNVGL